VLSVARTALDAGWLKVVTESSAGITAIKVAERIRTELAISVRFLRSLAAAGVMNKADVQRHTPNSTTHAAASEGLSGRILRAQRGSMRRLWPAC